MAYADFAYYTESFFGSAIPEEDFPRLSAQASRYLDYITRGGAQTMADSQPVKLACCALAEQFQRIAAAQALADKSIGHGAAGNGAELQSQTVGNWSRSYRSAGDSAISAQKYAQQGQTALYAVAMEYLADTGLLYRGGRRCR